MAKLKVPYFNWRGGRPRWEPGPHVRALGFRGQDLKGPDGNWLSEGDAIAQARGLNANVAAVRNQAATAPPAPEAPHTIRELVKRYRASGKFTRRAPSTRRDYGRYLDLIEQRFGPRLAGAIVRDEIACFLDELAGERGLATSCAAMRVFKVLLYFARDDLEWTDRNRLTKYEMATPEGRLVLWTMEEIASFLAAAERLKLDAQADACLLALLTGQRRGDLLRLPPLALEDGVYRIPTRKTGAVAYVPATRLLSERLAAMSARRAAAWPNVCFKTELVSGSGRAYDPEGSLFGDEFRCVRAAAAVACPPIAQKRFADLRDTAVTWLFDAGAAEPQIATITGHSLATVRTILDKHYFVRHAGQARAAGALLDAFLKQRGMG